MRILLLPAYEYGDPTFALMAASLATSYRKLGHQAVIAVPGRPCETIPGLDPAGAGEIHFLGRGRIRPFLRLIRLLRGMDLVHLHTSEPATLFLAVVWTACKLRKVPIGASIQDHNATPGHVPAWWEAPLVEALAASCVGVTSPSNFVVKELSRNVPVLARRARIVPHGIDEPPPSVPLQPAAINPFILCVGRIQPYKGIDLLLMAFRDLIEASPNVDLVVCGHDFGDKRFQGLAERLGLGSRVRFPGPQSRSEIWSLMRSCLFFVLPSRQEAFGIAALEAMAAGKAVLATRCGGPEDFLEHGKTALLVPPKDVRALAEGMLTLAGSPSLRETLGRAGAARAQAYRWEDAAKSYLRAFTHSGS